MLRQTYRKIHIFLKVSTKRFCNRFLIIFIKKYITMPYDSYYENMLFNFETTNRTDYRDGEIKPMVKTVYKEKPTCYRIRPPPLKDIHTLSDWKNASVPFSLLHKSKEVVRTNPRIVQQRYEKQPDLERESVQKTRPRLVMTPAVSMDDIEDYRARNLLCTDMYTSDMSRAMREVITAIAPHSNVKAPLPGPPAPSNPIVLPKLRPPLVAPEWRMDSVTWDGRQLRCHCDPTKEFWLRRDPPKCNACDVTAGLKLQKKLAKQMKC